MKSLIILFMVTFSFSVFAQRTYFDVALANYDVEEKINHHLFYLENDYIAEEEMIECFVFDPIKQISFYGFEIFIEDGIISSNVTFNREESEDELSLINSTNISSQISNIYAQATFSSRENNLATYVTLGSKENIQSMFNIFY